MLRSNPDHKHIYSEGSYHICWKWFQFRLKIRHPTHQNKCKLKIHFPHIGKFPPHHNWIQGETQLKSYRTRLKKY